MVVIQPETSVVKYETGLMVENPKNESSEYLFEVMYFDFVRC